MYRVLVFLYILYFICSPARAQDSLLLHNYQYVKTSDVWLTTNNAAALTRMATPKIAEANLSLAYGKGELTDFYDSPKVLQVGAAVESYYRLNSRTVVYGAISYDNWTGRDMTGSAFIHLNDRYPFDLVEDSLTNEGRKHRDTYQLTGAFGIDLWRGYAIGARVDYMAANYAKYKDLRHKNKLMDLAVSVGLYAPVAPWMSAGASYTYHRQSESIDFNTYGKNEKVFKTLIDYGVMTGKVEQFGNEGFTDKSREMPLFEDSHGGSFQLSLQPIEELTALASFTFADGNGYYGRRSPYTITYTQHDRQQKAATLALLWQPAGQAARYHLDLTYSNEKVANRAETYRELTNETSANYYEYYDPAEMGNKQWDDLRIAAKALLGIQGETPTWQLTASYQWTRRQQAAYYYPFYRTQKLTTGEAGIQVRYNLIGRSGIWSIDVEGGYQKGSGAPYEDGTFFDFQSKYGAAVVTPGEQQEHPAMMEAFLYREYRYLTASQYRLGAGLQYAFLFPGTRLKTHIRANVAYRHANESNDYCLGNQHTQLAMTVGCTF